MLAVSSTSRSTTVRPPAAASKSDLPAVRRSPPGIFVVILPAVEAAEESASASTVVLATTNPVGSWIEPAEKWQPADSSLVGVRVEAAEVDVVGGSPNEEICRLIELDEIQADSQLNSDAKQIAVKNLKAEDIVELFQTFRTPARSSAGWLRPLRVGNMRTLLAGLKNWVAREIERMAESRYWPLPRPAAVGTRSSAMDDRDYVDLIDSAIEQRRSASKFPLFARRDTSVRSSPWLFDFAALSFLQIAGDLEAAARQIATSCGSLLSTATGTGWTSAGTQRSAAFLP